MNIKPIGVGGYTDPATAGLAVESANNATNKEEDKVKTLLDMLESPSADVEKLRGIAADYDVTSIQPQELSEMIGRLYEAGALTEEEYQLLGMLRVELEKAGFEIDEPVNLIQFCNDKLEEIDKQLEQMQVPEDAMKNIQLQIAWLEKMAIIQEDPQAIGLNALI